ncbi:MAG: hypothetical protein FJZ10_05685, partial [Candidatus Omnitrophica bacterium]|nr:hypothetical protein [Candidatus Omnitrophota bacterium]
WAYAADTETLDSGLTFTISANTDPNNGVTIDSNRYIDIVPVANYFGQSDVTIRVTDPGGLSATDTFHVTVIQLCDDAPIAYDDVYSTPINTTLNVTTVANGVLQAGTDDLNRESGTTLTAVRIGTGIVNPSHGTLNTFNSNGTFNYTPNSGYSGSDVFTYKARSSGGVCGASVLDSAPANVTISINNTAPTLTTPLPDKTLNEDAYLNNTTNLWSYFQDAETADSGLTYTISNNTDTRNGVSIDTNQYIDIYPVANYFGVSQVTVRATDPGGLYVEDTFQVTVNQRCDDAPVAVNDSYTAMQNNALVVAAPGVRANDSNPEAGTDSLIMAEKLTNPSSGTVSPFNADGSFTYTPATGFTGTVTFTYRLKNTCSTFSPPTAIYSNTATVTITVGPCTLPVRIYNGSGTFVQCYNNIQSAINYASMADGYRIDVDPGTYTENISFPTNYNKTITVQSTGTYSNTTISGANNGRTVTFNPSTDTVTFNRFKVVNGRATSGDGAGIYINDAPVAINNCYVYNNTASTGRGGGIAVNSTKATTITGTSVVDNFATAHTASDGMYVAGSGKVTVSNSLIDGWTQGPSCLLPGTKIQLPNGELKSIEEVKTGDKVMSVTADNEVAEAEVTQTFFHPQQEGYLIMETEDGEILKVTGNHPINNGKDYVEASTLKVGDEVLVLDSKEAMQVAPKKIVRIDKDDSFVSVYNLEVEPHHTYIADGIVVHNKRLDEIVVQQEGGGF